MTSHDQSLIGAFFTICVLYIFFGSSGLAKAIVFVLMFFAGAFEIMLDLHSPLLAGWIIEK